MPNDSTLSECVWHMPLSLPGDGGAYAQWLHPEWMCMTYASFSARWWRCLCPMTPPWVNVYDICLFLCQVMEVPMPNDSTLSECVWHMSLSLPGDGGAYAQWLHPEWMCMTYASFSARWWRCLCPMTPPWVNVYDICLFLCQVMEVPMPNDSTLSECVWHMSLSLPGDGGAYAQWLHPEWMCMTYASFSARWWRCLCPMTPPWVNVYDICLLLCQVM